MRKLFRWILVSLVLTIMLSCSNIVAPFKKSMDIQDGTFVEEVTIRTLPTKAMIYINDRKVGKTPFRTEIQYSEESMLNIRAVPFHRNQWTQNLYLSVPPIPEMMTIYMNVPPKFKDYTDDDDGIKPLPKRGPIVITKIDTLEKIVERKIAYIAPVIYFKFDQRGIEPTQEVKLQPFIEMLKANLDFKIDVHGFADSRGNILYNRGLSLERGQAVMDYLIKNGISKTRLRVFADGEVETYNVDGVDMVYPVNRRVEFDLFRGQDIMKTHTGMEAVDKE
ncbi:MAG: OmpA family protein [Candidatus Zophobacter franzmannii]|nr:OmpA family protein [Candidatus Zophobacter franzmannii]